MAIRSTRRPIQGESYDDWFRRNQPGAYSAMLAGDKLNNVAPTLPFSAAGRRPGITPTAQDTKAQLRAARIRSARYKLAEGANQAVQTAATVGNAILPYASNIVNAFRRAPREAQPTLVPSVSGRRMVLDSARAGARDMYRNATATASRNLDENTAAAVSGATNAQYLQATGRIGETEANMNADISNRILGQNTQIGMFNSQQQGQWNAGDVDRRSADQTQQSQNISNAVDKAILMKNNEQDRLAVLDAIKIYNLNDVTGVKARLAEAAVGAGLPEDDINYFTPKRKTARRKAN